MSLFIGRDNLNRAIMHITEGRHTTAELKSGILPDTTFHNYLPFSQYTFSPRLAYRQNYNFYHIEDDGRRVVAYIVLDFGATINQKIASGAYDQLYFVNSSNNIITAASLSRLYWAHALVGWDYYSNKAYALVTDYGGGGTYVHKLPALAVFDGESQNSLIPLFMTISKVLFLEGEEQVFNNSGVTIGNGDIVVGGKSLTNFKYVYPGTINNHPSSIQISPGIQLVDTSQISGPIKIQASLDNVIIYKGDYPIITGNTGYLAGSGTTVRYNAVLNISNNQTKEVSLGVTMPLNNVVRVTNTDTELVSDKYLVELTNNVPRLIGELVRSGGVGLAHYYATIKFYLTNKSGTVYLKAVSDVTIYNPDGTDFSWVGSYGTYTIDIERYD